MPDVARLTGGTFFVRRRGDELWNRFELRLSTPEGDEVWDLGWHSYGRVEPWAGLGIEAFETQMRSSFDDHMYDLEMRELVPDKGYDELAVKLDLPDALRRYLEP